VNAAQISDLLTYRMYARNRGLGISQERLAGLFGEVPCEEMERQYQAEARPIHQVPSIVELRP
jgi:hypothetical protein